MASYEITMDLAQQAIQEIKDDYLKKHPISDRIKNELMPMVDANMKEAFRIAWTTSMQMHDDYLASHATNRHMRLQPLDERRLASLPQDAQDRMRRRHVEMEQKFQAGMEAHRKIFDDHHRTMLVGLFTGHGITKSTAEQIVDGSILGGKHGR